MGRACSTHERRGMQCKKDFGGKTGTKETARMTQT
jgi:hypothetical protein